MIDYTFSGVKVALTRKIKKSDLGKAQPVYWRVTFKRKQVYYYTGLKYHDSEWDDFINTKKPKLILKSILKTILNQLSKI
jgi:integrase/recombinase XerD